MQCCSLAAQTGSMNVMYKTVNLYRAKMNGFLTSKHYNLWLCRTVTYSVLHKIYFKTSKNGPGAPEGSQCR